MPNRDINYLELINKHKQIKYCLQYCINKIPGSWNYLILNVWANSVIDTIEKSLTVIWEEIK